MAETYYDHEDQHIVEAHHEHAPDVELGKHVKRDDANAKWSEVTHEESDGTVVSEVGVIPAQPAQPPGRNPATGEITPLIPERPRTRQKVHIAIHPHRRDAIAAALKG